MLRTLMNMASPSKDVEEATRFSQGKSALAIA